MWTLRGMLVGGVGMVLFLAARGHFNRMPIEWILGITFAAFLLGGVSGGCLDIYLRYKRLLRLVREIPYPFLQDGILAGLQRRARDANEASKIVGEAQQARIDSSGFAIGTNQVVEDNYRQIQAGFKIMQAGFYKFYDLADEFREDLMPAGRLPERGFKDCLNISSFDRK